MFQTPSTQCHFPLCQAAALWGGWFWVEASQIDVCCRTGTTRHTKFVPKAWLQSPAFKCIWWEFPCFLRVYIVKHAKNFHGWHFQSGANVGLDGDHGALAKLCRDRLVLVGI